jgi:hypothetical protein
MNRCKDQRLAELVGWAMRYVPPLLIERTPVDWFLGSDPVFAGLHHYETGGKHGWSYRHQAAHYVEETHQTHRPRSARIPTIVLPSVDHHTYDHNRYGLLAWVLHEFGHAVQHASERNLRTTWWADPVSEYAKTNHYEAFAEAFVDWRCRYHDNRVLSDHATVARFRLITHRS